MHWEKASSARSPQPIKAGAGIGRALKLAGCLGIIALSICPGSAHAGAKVSATGRATAVIVQRLSFIKTRDLDFGQFAATNRAGTVTIAPNGTRTATGGVVLFGRPGQAAAFSGYGFPNQTVRISVSSATGTVTRQGGTQTMQFDTFIVGSTPEAQITTRPLAFRIASASGMFAFPVGATLRVNANQAPGVYIGSFSVVLEYQ